MYQTTSSRQSQLSRYSFTCNCDRCVNHEHDNQLGGYSCKNKNCGNLLVAESTETLVCEKCSNKVSLSLYLQAEDKVVQHQNKAVSDANRDDYKSALTSVIESLKVGSFLSDFHHINYQSFQCAAVTFEELGNFSNAVKYIEKQLKCLELFKDGTMLVKEVSLNCYKFGRICLKFSI